MRLNITHFEVFFIKIKKYDTFRTIFSRYKLKAKNIRVRQIFYN
jgi:hypothetical protein